MVRIGERGVSDVVVIAFMFIILVLSATLLLGFSSRGMSAAADRRTELKANHLHRALERVEVRPGVTALGAAAEQLIVENPTVDNDYLKSWMENTLDFLRPLDHGVELRLGWENGAWGVIQPQGVEEGEDFLRRGSVAITKSGGDVVKVDVLVRIFEVSE